MDTKIREVFEKLCEKTLVNTQKIGSELREFKGCEDGQYFAQNKNELIDISHIFNWTQSFLTGMAALCFEYNDDKRLLRWLYSFYEEYYNKVYKTPLETMHDTGFLYTLYSTAAYNLSGDNNMAQLSVQAANTLAGRFVPNGGYIRAWGRMDDKIPAYVDEELAKDQFFQNSKGLAIIDCMMNLPLLFWASEYTGHPFYKRIAIEHANTTLKYFVRQDGSVCHAYRFNEENGEPMGEYNGCGYGVGSHWARGAAWAAYGFAIAYTYTQKQEYLEAALKITQSYVENCREDAMPAWDFRLPEDKPALCAGAVEMWDGADENNLEFNIDTSAAAVVCCAILQLGRHGEKFLPYADKALNTLLEKHVNTNPDFPGILNRQNGNNCYTLYGDYYMLEFLARKLGFGGNVW